MRNEQKELNYNIKLQQLLCLLLSNLFRNTEEMLELVLTGNKLSAQALQEIKMLQHNIKHQCLRGVEAKNSEIKFKTSLLQANVKGQWR